jgi:hypothetical protein
MHNHVLNLGVAAASHLAEQTKQLSQHTKVLKKWVSVDRASTNLETPALLALPQTHCLILQVLQVLQVLMILRVFRRGRVSSRGTLLHGEPDAGNKQPAPGCCWYPDM